MGSGESQSLNSDKRENTPDQKLEVVRCRHNLSASRSRFLDLCVHMRSVSKLRKNYPAFESPHPDNILTEENARGKSRTLWTWLPQETTPQVEGRPPRGRRLGGLQMDNNSQSEFNGRSMDEGCTRWKVQEGERHRCHARLWKLKLEHWKFEGLTRSLCPNWLAKIQVQAHRLLRPTKRLPKKPKKITIKEFTGKKERSYTTSIKKQQTDLGSATEKKIYKPL